MKKGIYIYLHLCYNSGVEREGRQGANPLKQHGETTMNVFELKKVANMVMVVDAYGQVWKAWNEREFTERKFNNYAKKLQSGFRTEITIVR